MKKASMLLISLFFVVGSVCAMSEEKSSWVPYFLKRTSTEQLMPVEATQVPAVSAWTWLKGKTTTGLKNIREKVSNFPATTIEYIKTHKKAAIIVALVTTGVAASYIAWKMYQGENTKKNKKKTKQIKHA